MGQNGIPDSYMRFDRVSRWPTVYVPKTRQWFIVFSLPIPEPGRHWLPAADVTDIADELKLNQGEIVNGECVWGSCEAVAEAGSEGRYVIIHLRDGTCQRFLMELAVDISIPLVKPRPDEVVKLGFE
jgi:hypothetical protein